ncbi:hypothetical protein DIPPA_35447 [Diplonema papillatum]|nr:hypothetical protein DIPPA_35447 [Diplonema papillatum]
MGACSSADTKPNGPRPSPEKMPGSSPVAQDTWENGKDFPSELFRVRIHNPDRELHGVVLTECLIDNALENCLVNCTVKKCTLVNCHLKGCTIESGSTVNRSVVKGGLVTDSTLTSGTEVSDDTTIDKCYITDRSTVTNCRIGPTVTTTGSNFINCYGNPEPAPAAACCTGCKWGSDEP